MLWTGHLVYLLVAGPGQAHDDRSGGAELHALHRGRHVAVCTPVQHLELSCPAPCHAPCPAPGPPLEEDSLVTKSLLDMTRIRLKDDGDFGGDLRGDFGGDFGGESRDSIQIPEPELTQLSATILGNYPSICASFLCYNKRSAICSEVAKDG